MCRRDGGHYNRLGGGEAAVTASVVYFLALSTCGAHGCSLKVAVMSQPAGTGELPPPQDARELRVLLDLVDRGARKRGEDYFREGRVEAVWCDEPGTQYGAEVRGGECYEVALYYEDGHWFADCTCPVRSECKHGMAAVFALLDLTGQPVKAASAGRAERFEQRVAAHWKRALTADEQKYARQVQKLYERALFGRLMTDDLRPFAPQLRVSRWEPVDLWEKPPATVVEFWQYLAFALTQRGAKIPAFLEPFTDHARVAQQASERERRRTIALWQERLQLAPPVAPDTEAREVRVMLKGRAAEVQWRGRGQAEFRPFKSSQIRQLSYNGGLQDIVVVPAAEPIWYAVKLRARHGGYSDLSLHDEEVQQLVRGWLLMEVLADRVVNERGQPFVHAPEPLRWDLEPAGSAEENYRVRLVDAQGRPVAGIRAVLPGVPTLYVTATTVFRGPPPQFEGDEPVTELSIPAVALETAHGAQWLMSFGLDLPPRLAERTRRVAVEVHVRCWLDGAGKSESLSAQITASDERGFRQEVYTPAGWRDDSRQPVKTAETADEAIYLFDRHLLARMPALLAPLGLNWDSLRHGWQARVTKKFPETFAAWLASLPAEVNVDLSGDLLSLRDGPIQASVRLDCTPVGVDWFDLKVALQVADTTLTAEELKILLDARGGWVRLDKRGWQRLQFDLPAEDDARLAQLGLSAHDFSSEPQRLHALQLADAAAARFLPEQQVREIRRRTEELQARVMPPVPGGVRAELRPYQVEGFHFLAYLATNRLGGILADDMGLGKTLQTLAWLVWLREQAGNAARPSLVVCPKSVMDNWRAEAERFAPGLRVRFGIGPDADVCVINYTQLRNLADEATGQKWLAVILDEGQYIKNPASQTARVAGQMAAEHRLVLTGTPIENRLLDLWSLMNFAMPGVLGNRTQFPRRFDQAEDPLARRRLAARVRPFLLRRTKGQVAQELPDRAEEDLLCEMEGAQLMLYRAEFKAAQQMLLKMKTAQEFDRNRFNFLTSLLRLRQICCHPALVDAQQRDAESAKMNALQDVLEPLMAEGHKVLVFSQFVSVLDLVEPVIRQQGWPYYRLTGATENRGELVAQFQQAPGAAVFLISLKAGGFGVNLTAASYVVLFDPWWNPAVENQAIDRTHRIGQTNKVMAYRLLIKNSIEEKIRSLQKQKRALAEDILGEERFAQSLTLEDLRFLFAE